MEISLAPLNLTKRVPLRISRGTMAGSTNAIVKVTHGGITGYGEMSPSQVTKDTMESAAISVERWQTAFVHASPLERETVLRDADMLLEVLPGIGGHRAKMRALPSADHCIQTRHQMSHPQMDWHMPLVNQRDAQTQHLAESRWHQSFAVADDSLDDRRFGMT